MRNTRITPIRDNLQRHNLNPAQSQPRSQDSAPHCDSPEKTISSAHEVKRRHDYVLNWYLGSVSQISSPSLSAEPFPSWSKDDMCRLFRLFNKASRVRRVNAVMNERASILRTMRSS